MKFIFICCVSIIFFLNTINTFDYCNICGVYSGIACASPNEFYVCDEGVPIADQKVKCPNGTVCETEKVCVDNKTAVASCVNQCGVCREGLRYTCVDRDKFQFCILNKAVGEIASCPTGQICHYAAIPPNFCVDATYQVPVCDNLYSSGSVPPNQTTTPLPNTTLNPNTMWCRQLGRVGRYPVIGDTTCKNYINCFVNNSQMFGSVYTCIGSLIFNPNLMKCVDPLTYGCFPVF